jgi:hypothetical protein
MSALESTRFYVYVHLKPDGTVFYVGKGCKRRAWSHHLRNKHWKSIVAKHGLKVTIVRNNLTEKQAFDLEKRFINYFKTQFDTLCNVTDGGGGVSGSHVNQGIPKKESHKNALRIANLGKVQSKETVEKRKKTMRQKVAQGWINPGAREEFKRKGAKNNNFAGWYVTPAGTFESVAAACVANNCSSKAVRVRCFGNRCVVKGRLYVYPPQPGWSFKPKDQ